MAFYESLEALLTASLLALAPTLGVATPRVPAPGHLDQLAADLRSSPEAAPLGAVLDDLAREIWLAQEPFATHHSVLEHHAVAVGHILLALPLDPQAARAAVETAAAAEAGLVAPAPVLADRLAQGLIARAGEVGALAARGLRPDIAAFVLACALRHLLASPARTARLTAMAASLTTSAGGMANAERAAPPAVIPAAETASLAPTEAEAETPPSPPALSTTSAAAAAAVPSALDRPETRAAIEAARRQLLAPANDPPELKRHKHAAAEALGTGDLELAAEHLKCARRAIRQARVRTAERLGEEMDALRRQMLEEAAASAAMGDVALAQDDHDSAAALYAEAAELLPAGETLLRLGYQIRQGEAQIRRGLLQGDALALAAAVAILRRVVETLPADADTRLAPLARRHLGQALLALGERTGDAALMHVATATLREAAEGVPRTQMPEAWAMAQIELADALARSDAAAAASDPARLFAAATAYEAALEVLTRDAAPMHWAAAETSLGAVLIRLGEQAETEALAHAYWQQAAAALLAALEVFEAHRAVDHAETTRRSLRMLHGRLQALVALPSRGAAE